jgi:hypothetical protein
MSVVLTESPVLKFKRIRSEKLRTVNTRGTDAELVQRALRRDLEAYGVLIERYQALVAEYASCR